MAVEGRRMVAGGLSAAYPLADCSCGGELRAQRRLGPRPQDCDVTQGSASCCD